MPRGPQRDRAGSEGSSAHTPYPGLRSVGALGPGMPPELGILLPLSSLVPDVLEPIDLQQPFSKRVSQRPWHCSRLCDGHQRDSGHKDKSVTIPVLEIYSLAHLSFYQQTLAEASEVPGPVPDTAG